jgi:hypothetical protein
MYQPTARLIIESKNGIDMVTGISKTRGQFLKFRQVVAGDTRDLPLYTININSLDKVDNILDKPVYYIKRENIMRVSK